MQVALWSASIVGAKHKQWPGCGGTPANGKGAGNKFTFHLHLDHTDPEPEYRASAGKRLFGRGDE
jgi:hypothetical protein